MIGMVNVPCESPLDFYASPSRPDTLRNRAESDSSIPRTPTKRTPSYRPLFTAHRKKVQYTEDGRKITDGLTDEQSEPNKLWEELLLRSFAQRMEDEIKSPVVESFKTLDEELARLNVQDKSVYRSTYSLVSNTRAEETDLSDLDRLQKSQRSASTDRICSAVSLAPFIKSIKGKKKKEKN
ncbi:unnamed protein product [Auanema sp. JU1783]|nr:unnamed protein product [Auanema sp. JU1783]